MSVLTEDQREVLRAMLDEETEKRVTAMHAELRHYHEQREAALRDALGDTAPRQTPEQIGPHEMVGDYECERCGESMQHYLHTDRDAVHDGEEQSR